VVTRLQLGANGALEFHADPVKEPQQAPALGATAEN
jgi:hypothetical protein